MKNHSFWDRNMSTPFEKTIKKACGRFAQLIWRAHCLTSSFERKWIMSFHVFSSKNGFFIKNH